MTPSFPKDALVVLIGPSGSGKTTFARRHFALTQILSSDACRAMVADDEADQSATVAAFTVLHCVLEQRLRSGRLTVVDATSVQAKARRPLLESAKRFRRPTVAILFDLPPAVCKDRNHQRPDRLVEDRVVDRQHATAPANADILRHEGFDIVFVIRSQAEADAFDRQDPPSPTAWLHRPGSFDIVGDIHGCCNELLSLFRILGYRVDDATSLIPRITAPDGRIAVFVGDFADRGPDSVRTFLIAMAMTHAGTALAVCGNHDDKLMRALRDGRVKTDTDIAQTLEELTAAGEEMRTLVRGFLEGLPSHLVLDDGRLVVAHAGLPQRLHGSESPRARDTAVYGTPTGRRDEHGFNILVDWAREYTGEALVVWGHLPVVETVWVGNTIDIDTACVHGGSLTALRYPEREIVSVPAACVYAPRISA